MQALHLVELRVDTKVDFCISRNIKFYAKLKLWNFAHIISLKNFAKFCKIYVAKNQTVKAGISYIVQCT
jgi:hypothetical protein